MRKLTWLRVRIDQVEIIQYLLIYIIIQNIGGRLQAALGADSFYGGVIVICSLLMMAFPKRLAIKKSFLKNLFLIAVSLSVTFVLTRGALGIGTILSLLSRYLIIYITIRLDPDNFMNRFLKMVYFMAAISLFEFFFVQLIGISAAKSVFSKLYEIKNDKFWLGSSYGLLFICYNFMDPVRNSYMFGEPGEYQSLLITAIYFLTFFSIKIEKKKNYYIVFIVALLTTQSTTGFLNLLAYILVVLLINKSKIPSSVRNTLIAGLLVAAGYLLFFYSKDSFLYTSFFGKIFNETGNLDFTVTTGAARVGPINRLIETFKQMPEKMVFGVGFEGLKQTPLEGYSTGGLINSIAMLGFVTTGIVYGKLIESMAKHAQSFAQIIFVIFYCINMGISQPDFLTITVVLMCMYCEYSGYQEIGQARYK